MLRSRMERSKNKHKGTGAMEEPNQLAKAVYDESSLRSKRKVEKEFKSFDKNEDGKISVQELKESLEKAGLDAMAKSNIFSLIDQNQNGYLQLDEFRTLSYLIESDRPTCNHCEEFITGAFFVCTDCYWEEPANGSYNLCIRCYKLGDFDHEHSEFLDNYTLLVEMKERLQESSSQPNGETSQPKTRKRDKLKKALKALCGVACGVARIGGTVFAVSSGHQSSANPANVAPSSTEYDTSSAQYY